MLNNISCFLALNILLYKWNIDKNNYRAKDESDEQKRPLEANEIWHQSREYHGKASLPGGSDQSEDQKIESETFAKEGNVKVCNIITWICIL